MNELFAGFNHECWDSLTHGGWIEHWELRDEAYDFADMLFAFVFAHSTHQFKVDSWTTVEPEPIASNWVLTW